MMPGTGRYVSESRARGTPPTWRDSRAAKLTSNRKTVPAGTPGYQPRSRKNQAKAGTLFESSHEPHQRMTLADDNTKLFESQYVCLPM